MKRYLIGDLLVEMDYSEIPVCEGNNLSHFLHNGEWSGETLRFRTNVEELIGEKDKLLMDDNQVYEVYSRNEEQMLVYHWGNQFHGFTVWPDRFSATFSPKMKDQPALREDWFFSIISFHKQLLKRKACVLHASYIDVQGNALLFTGPSNIGKSTQADLWKKNEGADIINGDRVVIRRKDGIWKAFGYPSCGTSGICQNKTLPLRAIIVLQQATDNHVEELSGAQKVRALVSAMELYAWDQSELDMAFELAQEIIKGVPIIRLCCRPDNEAVTVLKEYLKEEKDDNNI